MKAKKMLKYAALSCLSLALFALLFLAGYVFFADTNPIVISAISKMMERILWIISITAVVALMSKWLGSRIGAKKREMSR